jgi:tRNA modification GTPase
LSEDSCPADVADQELAAEAPGLTATIRPLVAVNKIDRAPAWRQATDVIPISALTGEGLDGLLAAIARRLVPHPPAAGAAVPFTPRQGDLLAAALDDLDRDRLEGVEDRLNKLLASD